MTYGLTTTPTLLTSECLVIGLLKNTPMPEFAAIIDSKQESLIKRLSKKAQGNGDIVCQDDVDGRGLLLINCGDSKDYTASILSKRIADVMEHLLKKGIVSATICMPQVSHRQPDWQIQQMILQIDSLRYQLLDFKTKDQKSHALESVTFFLPGASDTAIKAGEVIAQSVAMTRTLANMPANICTPTYLGQQALELAKRHAQVETKVFDKKEIEAFGMGALLAVTKGSEEPPRFVEIKYHGAPKDQAPIVLVGKGITVDSGGLSLKPADAMPEMKYDMAGAASLIGTINACALLNLPINVVALLACAENMPSGTAIKPGDIVTSMSGQTVEIINTDAEGRLVLADALTYAERFKPEFVIDLATLTGAVIVALGSVNTGMMTNDDALAKLILEAAHDSEDKVWRLPLEAEYQSALDSPLADMLNATFDRTAGSVTAACFLSRFTSSFRWAHLDIAGTAWVSGKKRNATGRPVPLLIELLCHVARSR